MNIVGISGSLRVDSYNTKLLQEIAVMLGAEHTLSVADISGIPLFNQDNEAPGTYASVDALRNQLLNADAIIIATPEYNHSVPGTLKNALDWMSRPPVRPLIDKPVLIGGVSNGPFGTVRAQNHLRSVLLTMGAQTFAKPEILIGNAAQKFSDGKLVDEVTLKIVRDTLSAFIKKHS